MKQARAYDTTLIIATYNNPVFLEMVFKSILRQQTMREAVGIVNKT